MNVELLEKLEEYPVIDKNFLKKHFKYNQNYAYLVLQRLKKRGIVRQIIKGKYTALDDPYKVASNIYTPSYISFLTASMLKKCTEQIINTVQVACNYRRTIDFMNYKIELVKINKKHMFGYENKEGIFICDNEKLLIDMLLYRGYCGNFSEIMKIVKNLKFNEKKIVGYLKIISNTSLTKRAGFLLDRYKKIDIRNKFELDNNYVFLDIFFKGKKTDSKWRIKYDDYQS